MSTPARSVWKTVKARQLAEALVSISDTKQMQNFLRDAMTEKEIIEISARFEAAKLLTNGIPYSQVVAKTKLSSRTVARISKWLKNGTGGYQVALQKIANHTPHTNQSG